MFDNLKHKIENYFCGSDEGENPRKETPFFADIEQNLKALKEMCNNTSDLVIREFTACGRRCAAVHIDGMINKYDLAKTVVQPIMSYDIDKSESGAKVYKKLIDDVLFNVDQMDAKNLEDCIFLMMSGFAAFIMDGSERVSVFGVQGYSYKGIGEPSTETSQYGSHEGFCESVRINMTMVRRRIKSTDLVFEYLESGELSNTNICLCYLKDMANPKLVESIRKKLKDARLPNVLAAEYLKPFLESKRLSLFDTVGITERPDVLCGKITEGRVGILVDGTPNAVIVPYLFFENFQTVDDYAQKPGFAMFSRWLRYISFFISIYLPAIYVALGVMHNELLPVQLLIRLADSEGSTPFSIMGEVFALHVVFELIREAGLRMPRPISSSVSFIATLLIGEAAVNAGFISLPAVMLVAVTGICSFTAPALYQPVAILRLALILIGGTTGVIGISVFSAALLVNICSLGVGGIPFTAPISPFRLKSMRDLAARANWKILGSKRVNVNKMPGSQKLD